MVPFGFLFVVVGALLIRQVVTGRAENTVGDIRDLAIAFFNGDVEGIRTVTSQRGTNVPTADSAPVASDASAVGTASPSALVSEMVKLGSAAKGYRLGATGPDYYDCSGLVWRAMKNLGMYDGLRFTTATFRIQVKTVVPVAAPEVPKAGDLVLWEPHGTTHGHIGVVVNGDQMYSARSTKKGINYSSISGDTGYFGRSPSYWRVTG